MARTFERSTEEFSTMCRRAHRENSIDMPNHPEPPAREHPPQLVPLYNPLISRLRRGADYEPETLTVQRDGQTVFVPSTKSLFLRLEAALPSLAVSDHEQITFLLYNVAVDFRPCTAACFMLVLIFHTPTADYEPEMLIWRV